LLNYLKKNKLREELMRRKEEINLEELRREMGSFYQTSTGYLENLVEKKESYFQLYTSFVKKYAEKGHRILDLGCGHGLSSYLLSKKGFLAVGLDISPLFLKEAPKSPQGGPEYIVADALELPFLDESFDAVSSHEFIEHISDVEKACLEMTRVVKKGGFIIILSPNLCSPFWVFKDLSQMVSKKWKGRPPWYRSRREALLWGIERFLLSLKKKFSKRIDFIYRKPSLRGGEDYGDGDSVYLANPLDLERFFLKKGLEILSISGGGTLRGRLGARLFPHFNNVIALAVRK
jgi:SAM-dependent methyltransferase